MHGQQASNALLCLVFKVMFVVKVMSLHPTNPIALCLTPFVVRAGKIIIAQTAQLFGGNKFVPHPASGVLLQLPHQPQQQIQKQQQPLPHQLQRQPLEPQVAKDDDVLYNIFELNFTLLYLGYLIQ